MMLKLLVGLSLATTTIMGKVITPQNIIDPQHLTNCNHSEVLLKVWSIISNLFGPDGKTVRVPDALQLNYALTLIKKSLEQHSTVQDFELSKKLKLLETELAHNKEIILNDQRPLRTLLDTDPVKNDLSSNMLFKYNLPNNIKPSCKEAFLNLIHVAQEAYVNIAKSPVCNDVVPKLSAPDYYVPTGQLHQNPYNSAFLSNVQTPSEDALKRVTEYLQAPGNYNSNNLISLLQGVQPKAPYLNNPLYNGLNPYSQPQINNALDIGQTPAPNNMSDVNSDDINSTANVGSPLQGDFNVNLEHAKEIAEKMNAQNNLYINEIPDSTETNAVQQNSRSTPRVGVSQFQVNGEVANNPSNPDITSTIQKQMHNIPVENGNYANLQNYVGSQTKLHGNYYPNPYQYHGNLIGGIKKLNTLPDSQNMGDHFKNSIYYQAGINNPGSSNHYMYQNAMPYQQLPNNNPFVVNYNNNHLLDKQLSNDLSGLTNSGKLETNIIPNGAVELTYLLKRKRPLIYQPFYFVKYRLPYISFVQNLRQMLSLEPDLRTPPTELYKGLIAPSNATEVSPDLAPYPKEEIHSLVLKDGALVKATYIQPNGTKDNDTTVDLKRESSEVNFGSGNTGKIVKRSGLNTVEEYPPYLVQNQAPNGHENPSEEAALSQARTPYETRTPMHDKNQQTLIKLLSALGLENLLNKETNTAKLQYAENQSQLHQETPLNNIGNPSIYQQAALNQQNSPFKVGIQALPGQVDPPSFVNRQTFSSHGAPSYNEENQDVLGQKKDEIENQFASPPYVIGTQAVSGLSNDFLGNNLIRNSLSPLRRLTNGYGLNPYQNVGNSRPGSYPSGLASPYSGLLGNQGPLVQAGYLGNNYPTSGLPQQWYQMQRPFYG